MTVALALAKGCDEDLFEIVDRLAARGFIVERLYQASCQVRLSCVMVCTDQCGIHL